MFGSMQMAVSRVINLQHHRIAQVETPSLYTDISLIHHFQRDLFFGFYILRIFRFSTKVLSSHTRHTAISGENYSFQVENCVASLDLCSVKREDVVSSLTVAVLFQARLVPVALPAHV